MKSVVQSVKSPLSTGKANNQHVRNLRKLFRTIRPPASHLSNESIDEARSPNTRRRKGKIRSSMGMESTTSTIQAINSTNAQLLAEDITIFENAHEPAIVIEKPVPLKWKKGYEPDDVELSAEELDDLSFCGITSLVKADEYRIPCRILLEVCPGDILENLLDEDENRIIRDLLMNLHRQKPTKAKVFLLQKAMDNLYVKIVCDVSNKMVMKPDMLTFLNSPKCKSHFLDVILFVPDFMPICWGGVEIGKKISDDSEAAGQLVKAMRDAKTVPTMRTQRKSRSSSSSISQSRSRERKSSPDTETKQAKRKKSRVEIAAVKFLRNIRPARKKTDGTTKSIETTEASEGIISSHSVTRFVDGPQRTQEDEGETISTPSAEVVAPSPKQSQPVKK